MKFTKMHGTGNDFIMVDCINPDVEINFEQLAKSICQRHYGVGADGIILIIPSEAADFKMRMFNPDGSEAEMCGNGIRCLARYVYKYGHTDKKKFDIETMRGIINTEIKDNSMVKVDMGEPILERADIPMEGKKGRVVNEQLKLEDQLIRINAVSMGNPHCVVFVDDVNNYPVEEMGPIIENHSLFPKRTNVEFVQVINKGEIGVKVWERGAGITLACGTGACATVVAGVLNDQTDNIVTVHLPGGDLVVEWNDTDNHVYMTGEVKEVFVGELDSSKF